MLHGDASWLSTSRLPRPASLPTCSTCQNRKYDLLRSSVRASPAAQVWPCLAVQRWFLLANTMTFFYTTPVGTWHAAKPFEHPHSLIEQSRILAAHSSDFLPANVALRAPLASVCALAMLLPVDHACMVGLIAVLPLPFYLMEAAMAGWYELSKNDKGQFFFVLKAGNAEVILRSEQYETRAAAEGGIASVQKNSPADERYERKDANDGRFYFNLKAANHQVIGTSQMYKAAASREGGIESVKTNGPTTTIKTD